MVKHSQTGTKRCTVSDHLCGLLDSFPNRKLAFAFAIQHQNEHDSGRIGHCPTTVEITDTRAKDFTNDKWVVSIIGHPHVVPGWSQRGR